MKKILMLSYLMISSFFLYSQKNGVVLDKENNPIDNVNVFITDQNTLLYNDNKGLFSIDGILNGTYIHLYKHGYLSQVYLYKENEEIKIILEELHVSLDEIGVVESFNELGNNKLTNIEKKSLKNNFLNSNSLVDNITELSGVNTISSGLGIQKVVVRGLSGMRVVSYLNGMKINNQQWANDHGIGFTDLGLSEFELIKGASALKFGGEAIGGLLYFKDEPFISNNKIKGFVASKFNNSSYLSSSQFGLKINRKNLHLNVNGQYSISSDYRLPNNSYLFNSRFKQDAFKLSIGYKHNRWHNIIRYQLNNETNGLAAHSHGDPSGYTVDQFTSTDLDLNEDFNIKRPTQYVKNQLFIYETKYLINNLKFSFHAGHFINNLIEYDKLTVPSFDLTITNTQLTPNIRYIHNNFTINVGSQISLLENKNNFEEKLMPDANSSSVGTYAIMDYEKNNFGFNSGLRLDNKTIISKDISFNTDYNNKFSSTSFSTGIYYKKLDHTLRFTYSGAFRAPHFSELFSDGVHHGTNRYEIGNQNLNIEYSNQFDLKYQWSNEHIAFVVNPFIQYIDDFISIEPTDSYNGRYKVYNYVQFKEVEISGVEMNIHYHPQQLHNLHFEQGYTFLQAKNKSDDYNLALVPANNIKTKVLFDLEQYQNISKYKFNYISIYHYYTFDQKNFAEYEELTEGYNVVNLKLGFKLSKKLNAVIGVDNLLNEEYSPHTSRIRNIAGGIPNPGRSFNINIKYDF